jgi:hypothetical protein
MSTIETLRSIIDAADSHDSDDVATRGSLVAGLGAVIAACPVPDCEATTAQSTAHDGNHSPECAIGRRQTEACGGCLLSQ